MKKIKITAALLFFLVLILVFPHFTQAQSANPQETLKQYISELQNYPNDNALREKIIKFAQEMKPAPAVPEEAERYMARGVAAMKGAKSETDFKDAVKEFEKASLSAPWLANVYYNLGVAQDKAGMYAEAIKSLKLYLFAVPDAADAKNVKTLVYEIEYRQEKAAKESSPKAIAEKKQKEYEEWLKNLDGVRYTRVSAEIYFGKGYHNGALAERHVEAFEIFGKEIIYKTKIDYEHDAARSGNPVGVWKEEISILLHGREFSYGKGYDVKGTISADGNTISANWHNGFIIALYRRER